MGEKLIYMSIANGQIYLKRTDPLEVKIFGDKMIDLDIDLWDDVWYFYINPDELFKDDFISLNSNTLNERLNDAIQNEDYELASKIKELIKKNK